MQVITLFFYKILLFTSVFTRDLHLSLILRKCCFSRFARILRKIQVINDCGLLGRPRSLVKYGVLAFQEILVFCTARESLVNNGVKTPAALVLLGFTRSWVAQGSPE